MNKYAIYIDETRVFRHQINIEGDINEEELDQLCSDVEEKSFNVETIMRGLAKDKRLKSISLSLSSNGDLAKINIPEFEEVNGFENI